MKHIPIVILLIVGITVRVLYGLTKPTPIVAPDTYGYYLIGQRIVHKTVPVFNDERTPVYPLFLSAVMFIRGSFNAPILSPDFYKGASAVTVVQALLGIIGYLLLFKLIYELTHEKTLSLLLTIILSLNTLHFGWEHVLTAESMTFFWLSLLLYVCMVYLKKPTHSTLLILIFLFIVGFLLKPLFIGLPLFIVPILTWKRGMTKMFAVSTAVLFLYGFIPMTYIKTNVQRKNYYGINHVSDVNLLGKILEYRIPVSLTTTYSKLASAIGSYQQMTRNPDPYAFLSWYEPNLLTGDTEKRTLNELRSVTIQTIQSNLVPYGIYSIGQIPRILARSPDSYAAVSRGEKGFAMWNVLQMLFRAAQYISFLMIVCFLHAMYIFIKSRRRQSALMLLVCAVFFYQLMMVSLFAFTAEEYGRLMSPMMPFVYGIIVSWIYTNIYAKNT